MVIEKVKLYRLQIPLKQPYKIASAVMTYFDCTIVALQSSGREGLGEAMSGVEGYFWETPDQVWQFAREKGRAIVGKDLSAAKQSMADFVKKAPCATTPFLAALETVSGDFALTPPAQPILCPIVGILQENNREGIMREIDQFMADGYQTIKIKVGFDVEQDIGRVRMAQEALQGKAQLRADANQGYTYAQAARFVKGVDPGNLQFLEQPFKEKDWAAMAELAKISPIPLGLDESIYDMESVDKARQLKCAQFVKFKLMKVASAQALVECIEKSRQYGFGVILGNGAAGEISCYQEALVAGKTGTLAGEMNGFLKQTESVLVKALGMEGGNIRLAPDFKLQLDEGKVEKFAIDQMVFA
jgi:L-alanine-DL-glutamate epimerase-like enolase superfamily enzyme